LSKRKLPKKAAKKAITKKVAKKSAPAKKSSAKKPKKLPANPAVEEIPEEELSESEFADELFTWLPPRQQVFISNYLANGFNATKAAIDAGFSEKTADSQASRLLKNAKVRAIINARKKNRLQKLEITAERTLREIGKLAFFDPGRYFDELGNLIPIHELDDECRAALAGMDVKELYLDKCPVGQLKKIKFADKTKSLEMLGRYFKMFTDKTEVTHKIERVVVREAIKQERVLPPSQPEF